MAAAGAGAAAAGTEDITLDSAPTDGITRVAFSPTSAPLLLATSWDTSARVYDVATNTLKATLPTAAPLLDGCWVDDHSVAAGGLDKTVRMCVKPIGRRGARYGGRHLRRTGLDGSAQQVVGVVRR